MYPPSHCPRCGVKLGALELLPVVGYAVLGGRCRRCGGRISVFYPAMEIGVGLIFAFIVLSRGVAPVALSYLILASLVVVAAGIDLCHRVIPDKLTVPWMAVGVLTGMFGGLPEMATRVIGLVTCGGLVCLIVLVSRGGMGGGDVKLMALVGSFLGPLGGIASFMIACFAGAIVGIALLALGIRSRKDEIPFAPFIAAGAVAVCVSGTWALRVVFPWLSLPGV